MLLIFLTTAQARAVGMAVTDPILTSAVNAGNTTIKATLDLSRIEQIKQTIQLVESASTLQYQLRNLRGQLESMTINLKRAMGYENIMATLIKDFTLDMPSFGLTVDVSTGQPLNPTIKKDIAKLLDQTFVPFGKNIDRRNYEEVKESYRQRSYKSAISSAELVLNKYPDRAASLSKTVMQINTTDKLKDSVDLMARLIGEMLVEQQKTNVLLAQLVRSNASSKFEGLKENVSIDNNSKAKRKNYLLKGKTTQ